MTFPWCRMQLPVAHVLGSSGNFWQDKSCIIFFFYCILIARSTFGKFSKFLCFCSDAASRWQYRSIPEDMQPEIWIAQELRRIGDEFNASYCPRRVIFFYIFTLVSISLYASFKRKKLISGNTFWGYRRCKYIKLHKYVCVWRYNTKILVTRCYLNI